MRSRWGAQMAAEPKPFQQATSEAALTTFRAQSGSRRFLVADEVGLGKTIVARGLIERLCRRRSAPLRVFYVCSNLTIAKQNLARLVAFLPESERKIALSEVDRPSLMPTGTLPSHPRVHVFSLTPATSIPSRRGRRDGRVQERALARALLRDILPNNINGLHRALRVNASSDRFDGWVKYYEHRLADP